MSDKKIRLCVKSVNKRFGCPQALADVGLQIEVMSKDDATARTVVVRGMFLTSSAVVNSNVRCAIGRYGITRCSENTMR
ncbi:hypothetical protein [Paraburkholderia fungorum]|jgi:hypothetical protein|uniref:hypothetical protein n=1 Tax=Paraburkholderia fungorum TaxID=134537 RepID=UPI0038BC2CEB